MPASFRSFLTTQGYNGFVSYPSFSNPALECCTQDRIEKLSNSIDTLNPFEEKRDYFATAVLSESSNLILIQRAEYNFQKLLNVAKIKSDVLFVDWAKHSRFGS